MPDPSITGLPAQFIGAAAPLLPDYATRRQAAPDALTEQHDHEYQIVHNGSGLSEEMPSDLAARHRAAWDRFESYWPESAPAAAAVPAPPSP